MREMTFSRGRAVPRSADRPRPRAGPHPCLSISLSYLVDFTYLGSGTPRSPGVAGPALRSGLVLLGGVGDAMATPAVALAAGGIGEGSRCAVAGRGGGG